MVVRYPFLVNGEIYHVFSRAIESRTIFRDHNDYRRMEITLFYYVYSRPSLRLSEYLKRLKSESQNQFFPQSGEKLVKVICYCLMPNHIHLVLQQVEEKGISIYTGKVLNSYARYFNEKYKRKGPLWESRFKNVKVESNEQLLHLTRYIHLNPVTAFIVDKPEEWKFSSYKEYLGEKGNCEFEEFIESSPEEYRKFVHDRISYQRELNKIKTLIMENLSS